MTFDAKTQSEDTSDSSSPLGRLSVAFIVFLSVVAGCGQLWLIASDSPLGVPDEWTWPRFEFDWATVNIFALASAGLASLFLILYGMLGTRKQTTSSRIDKLWLCGLLILGLGWVNAVSAIMPPEGGLSRSAFVLFYPRTTGYYWQAKYEVEDLNDFLRNYKESIQDQSDPENYLHIGTHPPGLTAGYRLMLNLCDASPGLVNLLESTQPESVRDALKFIANANRTGDQKLSSSDLAALWLAVILSQFIAVATIIPLYYLCRKSSPPETSKLIVVAWLLVPAVLVFLPKSDAVFPCLTCCIQLSWCNALQKDSKLWGAITAVILIAAATLSLAFFTIGLILLFQLIHSWTFHKRGLSPTLSGLIVGLLFLGVLYVTLGVNLPAIWLQNFRNHAVFYDHNTRTYFDWLFVNLLEAGGAVGGPLAMMALFGMAQLLRRFRNPAAFIPFSGLLVWGILWLSGKNMGEAARLWILLLPYAFLAICPIFERLRSSEKTLTIVGPLQLRIPVAVLIVLCFQLVVCIHTAITLDGFGMTEL